MRDTTSGRPAIARINHGRWIADCHLDYGGAPCLGAELVDPDEPFMLCLSCGNKELGGRFRRVNFPASRQRIAIEAALNERFVPFQNWRPGETAADLEKENLEYGIVGVL